PQIFRPQGSLTKASRFQDLMEYGGLAKITLKVFSWSVCNKPGSANVSPRTILNSSIPSINIFMRAIAEVIKLISCPYNFRFRYSLPSSFRCKAQFNNKPPEPQVGSYTDSPGCGSIILVISFTTVRLV